MNEDQDLSEGFPEYQRPPRDIVPKAPAGDSPPIPVGPATLVHYDITEDGVTRTEEDVFVARPITGKETRHDDE